MKKFLNKYGLFLDKQDINPYSYSINDYITTGDTEKLKTHLEFLKGIESEENNRLSIIENKTSQLVSQTGIIFSLLSLFIPIFIDKVTEQHWGIRLFFLIILVIAFLFYMLTIRNAIKNYNVKNFIYSKSSPINVINHQSKSVDEFNVIEIKDLLYGANQNLKTNNVKATNLIHAYHAFKIANVATAILVVLICTLLLFIKPKSENADAPANTKKQIENCCKEEPKITIENNPVFINGFEKKDTTIIKKHYTPIKRYSCEDSLNKYKLLWQQEMKAPSE